MSAAVHAIHDGIGGAFQFVVEAASDEPAHHGIVQAFAGQHIAGRATFNPAFGEAAMDALDDVAALAELAQRRLGLLGHGPLAGRDLVSQPERLELAKPPDLEGMEFVRLAVGVWREVDDAEAGAVSRELPVQVGPALGVDLAFEDPTDLVIGPGPKLLRDQVARTIPHALLDVIARDDEVLAVVPHAPHDQVDVRMLGIPVIDGDPVEAGTEVQFHLPDEIACKGLEVGHFHGVVGRDDEAEMMPVRVAPLRKLLRVDGIDTGAEKPGLLSVPGDALAPEVVEMGRERCSAAAMAHHARLDHTAPRERDVMNLLACTDARWPSSESRTVAGGRSCPSGRPIRRPAGRPRAPAR